MVVVGVVVVGCFLCVSPLFWCWCCGGGGGCWCWRKYCCYMLPVLVVVADAVIVNLVVAL